MTEKLTIEQAYRAMFYFLEHEWELTQSDDIGGLLGELNWNIFVDSAPADPAVWGCWLEAVEKALRQDEEVVPPPPGIRTFDF